MSDSVRTNSDRSEAFKKKSSITDKRSLRVHRRSLEWKQMRNETVNQNRRLDSIELSPLKELQPAEELPKTKSNARPSQRELLKKWQEEKALKKKLEAKKKHQTFKVAHVEPELVAFSKPASNLPKVKDVSRPGKTTARKVTIPKTPNVARKVTVAAAGKRNAKAPPIPSELSAKAKPTHVFKSPEAVPTRRVTRSQTSASSSRGSTAANTKPKSNAKREKPASPPKPAPKAKSAPKGKANDPPKKKAAQKKDAHVTSTRGDASFAPTSFQFKAPESLKSFTFKPLSPSSTAQFLGTTLAFSPLSARRCSTPKHRLPVPTGSKLIHSPPASAISEVPSSASDEEKALPKMPQLTKSSTDSDTDSKTVLTESRKSGRKSTSRKSSSKVVSEEAKPSRRKSVRKSVAISTSSESADENVAVKPQRKSLAKSPALENSKTKDQSEQEMEVDTTESNKKTSFAVEASAESETESTKVKRKSSRKSQVQKVSSPGQNETSLLRQNVSQLEISDETEAKKTPNRKRSRKSVVSTKKSEIENENASMDVMASEEKTLASGEKPFRNTPGKRPLLSSTSVDEVFTASSHTPASILRDHGSSRKHSRAKSMSVTFTPAAVTPRRNNRCSLMLRHMSPEDGVEILKNSPMVELERRSHKKKTPCKSDRKSIKGSVSGLAMPTFDDMDDLPAPPTSSSVEDISAEHMAELGAMNSSINQTTESSAATSDTVASINTTNSTDALTDASTASAPAPTPAAKESEEEAHDVPYFRRMVAQESTLLDELCDKWTKVLEGLSDVSEEVLGQIRTVIGKAQLLTGRKGRFTQFISLVDACEFKTGEKETTEQDLQGFWDMVYFQVEDVYAMFGDLDKLRDQNWVVDVAKPKKVVKKVVKKKPVSKPAAAAKAKGPSKFAAFRAQMKQKKQQEQEEETDTAMDTAENPAQDNLLQVPQPTKTFEGGFFKVRSPVKSPEYHCEGGTPLKGRSRENTPKEIHPRESTPKGPIQAKKRGLARLAVERSARKSYAPPPEIVVGEEDIPASPSKKQRLETSAGPMVVESIFSPASASASRRSSRRQSVRRSIAMDPAPAPTLTPAPAPTADAAPSPNLSFSKYLVSTGPPPEPEAMSELSLNTSPAGSIFRDSPNMSAASYSRGRSLSMSERYKQRRSSLHHRRSIALTDNILSPATLVPGFTPPTKVATPAHKENMEAENTLDLMCFSPVVSSAASKQDDKPLQTRTRKSSRISLL